MTARANEEYILRDVRRRFAASAAAVLTGPGDDAAVLRRPRKDLLITCDALVEGEDFDLKLCRHDDAGFKAVAAAVSDIYACGGRPTGLLVAAGLPRRTSRVEARSLLRGIEQAAKFHRAPVIGGDISAADKLFLSVTVLGEAIRKPVLRSGARPGDHIYVTGPVGAAGAALLATRTSHRMTRALYDAQFRPSPNPAGAVLAALPAVRAAIDVSDGLLLDLSRVCDAGRVSAEVDADLIPVHPTAAKIFREAGLDPRTAAATAGEDYVLILAVRAPAPRAIARAAIRIGTFVGRSSRPVTLRNARLPARLGFVHNA